MVGPAQDPNKRFGATCVDRDAYFFVCSDSRVQFVGCCTIDPCKTATGDCPIKNLRKATFQKELYDEILPQDCVSGSSSVLWFACSYKGSTDPAFMGCCGSNPCTNAAHTCPDNDFSGAKLSTNKTNAANFLPDGYFDRTTTISGISSATVTVSGNHDPTASSNPVATSSGADSNIRGSSRLSTGSIIGIAVGSAFAVLAIAVAAFCLWKRRKPRKGTQPGGITISNSAAATFIPVPNQPSNPNSTSQGKLLPPMSSFHSYSIANQQFVSSPDSSLHPSHIAPGGGRPAMERSESSDTYSSAGGHPHQPVYPSTLASGINEETGRRGMEMDICPPYRPTA